MGRCGRSKSLRGVGMYWFFFDEHTTKEVCNGGVACSLLKLGGLEKTDIAFLFHSGLQSGTIFCGKKMSYVSLQPKWKNPGSGVPS